MVELAHPRLRRLYDYWEAKRGDRRMPSRADIDPLEMVFIIGSVLLVDVLAETPPRFRIRLFGSRLAQRAEYDVTGKMLDELPANEFRTLVRERWNRVAVTGEPLDCHSDRMLDDRVYRYESIILPLSQDGASVNMLLVALLYDDEPR